MIIKHFCWGGQEPRMVCLRLLQHNSWVCSAVPWGCQRPGEQQLAQHSLWPRVLGRNWPRLAAACAHRAGLSWVLGQPASLQPMVGHSFRFFWSELDVGNPLPPAACLLPRWASPSAAGSLPSAPAAAAPSLCFPRLSKNAISGGLLQILSKGTCVVHALFSKSL